MKQSEVLQLLDSLFTNCSSTILKVDSSVCFSERELNSAVDSLDVKVFCCLCSATVNWTSLSWGQNKNEINHQSQLRTRWHVFQQNTKNIFHRTICSAGWSLFLWSLVLINCLSYAVAHRVFQNINEKIAQREKRAAEEADDWTERHPVDAGGGGGGGGGEE